MEMPSIRLLGSLLAVAVLPCLNGQSLKIQSSITRKGESGFLYVVLDAPAASAPVALQWELILPKDVTIGVNDITMPSPPESVNKVLSCAVKPEAQPRYVCTLAGGNKPIPNGPVAAVRYRIAVEVHKITDKVRIENATGVKSDGAAIHIPDVQQTLAVK
jgi:hypothetical protein